MQSCPRTVAGSSSRAITGRLTPAGNTRSSWSAAYQPILNNRTRGVYRVNGHALLKGVANAGDYEQYLMCQERCGRLPDL